MTPYVATFPVKFTHDVGPHDRLVLVDTPSFNDNDYRSYHDVLDRISKWLVDCYRAKATIVGIVYVHDISRDRVLGSTRTNLEIFKNLCGKGAFKKVVFATTHSQCVLDPSRANEIEDRMKQCWWDDALREHAWVMRIEDDCTITGNEIVEHLIDSFVVRKEKYREGLLIQQELVDMKRHLYGTSAGKQLASTLQNVARRLGESLVRESDEEEKQEIQQILESVNTQVQILQPSLPSRIKDFFWHLPV